MDNATAVSATNVSGGSLQSTIKDLPIAKVWAFAVGQFGWALLSGIISNWLVYFYQPDQETISQGQTVFVPQSRGAWASNRGGRHHRIRPIL